ncbi:hypothetical protein PGQ11_010188 [Apiospora arundinis]|uniref:Uncharacterized protein n=1 Tax=Apiospora arundinis TaxID=335852 RepID=A0ABR2I8Y3_9PEZI
MFSYVMAMETVSLLGDEKQSKEQSELTYSTRSLESLLEFQQHRASIAGRVLSTVVVGLFLVVPLTFLSA